MSEKRRSSDRHRRRYSGLSLLASEDELYSQIPQDIPEEERSLILIRKTLARTVRKLQQEHNVPEDLVRALTVDGTAAFQDLDSDDILIKILRASPTKEDTEYYHKEFGALVAESKAWDQLLQPGYEFRPYLPPPPSCPDPADIAKIENHYKVLADNCARLDHASSLQLAECSILQARRKIASAPAEALATSAKQGENENLAFYNHHMLQNNKFTWLHESARARHAPMPPCHQPVPQKANKKR
ncbi:unnamed protein product [Ixodes persulcatus]